MSVASTASSASAGIMEMMVFSSHHPVLIILVVSTRVCSVTNNEMELQPGSLPKDDEDMSLPQRHKEVLSGREADSFLIWESPFRPSKQPGWDPLSPSTG